MARLFVIHVYRHKGAPMTIVIGPGWTIHIGLLERVLRAPRGQIESCLRAFHLKLDGQTEIVNQYMAQRLRPYVDYYQDDWSEWLPWWTSLPHVSLMISRILSLPHRMWIRTTPVYRLEQTKEPQTVKERINRDDARKFRLKRMEDIWDTGKGFDEEAQGQQKRQADRSSTCH